jgi:signal transduction histidine kinase
VEVFVIDNGTGCHHILKSYGLLGIEMRFEALGGKVHFGSDGEHGFTIHAKMPITTPV